MIEVLFQGGIAAIITALGALLTAVVGALIILRKGRDDLETVDDSVDITLDAISIIGDALEHSNQVQGQVNRMTEQRILELDLKMDKVIERLDRMGEGP